MVTDWLPEFSLHFPFSLVRFSLFLYLAIERGTYPRSRRALKSLCLPSMKLLVYIIWLFLICDGICLATELLLPFSTGVCDFMEILVYELLSVVMDNEETVHQATIMKCLPVTIVFFSLCYSFPLAVNAATATLIEGSAPLGVHSQLLKDRSGLTSCDASHRKLALSFSQPQERTGPSSSDPSS